MKKLFIFFIIMVLLSAIVGSVFDTDFYYKLEDVTEENGGTSLTLTNAPPFIGGKLGDGIGLDGSTQYATVVDGPAFTFTDSLTINYWLNGDDTPVASDIAIQIWDASNVAKTIYFDRRSDRKVRVIGDGTTAFDLLSDTLTTNGQWHMITVTLDGTTARLFIDGTEEDTFLSSTSFADIDSLRIGATAGAISHFDGIIDDFSITPFDRDQAWIDARWNGGSGSEVPELVEDVFPQVIFMNQTLSDITNQNIFGSNLSIYYNITNRTNLIDFDSIVINYNVNHTTNVSVTFINGTAITENKQRRNFSNTSVAFEFILTDNEVYPTISNFDEENFENTVPEALTVSTPSQGVKHELLNISSMHNFTFIELMVNNTLGTGALEFHYCNSTYSSGNYETSSNCASFFSLSADLKFNHSEPPFAFHHLLPLNIVNESIGNVHVTSTSFIIVDNAVGNFECVLEDQLVTGDHVIFSGGVVASYVNTEPTGRLYTVDTGWKMGGVRKL